MIFEMRIYSIAEGRMSDNIRRFEHLLPPLFARHRIANVGRWMASDGADGPQFVYMMAYADLEEREARWHGFYDDDEWWQIRVETNGVSQIVERYELHFLRPNRLWSVGSLPRHLGGVHDLRFFEVLAGAQQAAEANLRDVLLPLVEEQGGEVMMVADFLTGVRLPRLALMTGWQDATHLHQAMIAIGVDPRVAEGAARERATLGDAAIGHALAYTLKPTCFALPEPHLGLRR